MIVLCPKQIDQCLLCIACVYRFAALVQAKSIFVMEMAGIVDPVLLDHGDHVFGIIKSTVLAFKSSFLYA